MNRAYVLISSECIGSFCKPTNECFFKIKSEIPSDALFIGVHWSFEKQCFLVAFEHPSFPYVKDGDRLTRLKSPEFEKYYFEQD